METLGFTDQNAGYNYSVNSTPDPTFGLADASDGSLENFFSRPVKIASYSWGTGLNLFESFNPWKLFWENPRVINRVSNYNLLRSKLCVKFIINGNGFYYGRAICSYIPLHTRDTLTKDRAFFIEDVVEASQRPHIFLDPTNSQGGMLCLPFVKQNNAIDIPDVEWNEMGQIIIHGMQELKHANGATGDISVSVFAWAEDVVLSIPTANQPGAIAPQAGEIGANDEYGKGIISTPAAFIAKAAGMLSSLPTIGPYATATQIGASAISAIAKTFGYSRPIDVEPIRSYKPTYLGNMANTNAIDTSNKLALDSKQELTVDTRTFGLDGTDEMTISNISTRESFLTQFAWPVAAATESLLWNTEVNPVVWNELIQGTTTEYHMPACCFAALPFRHWRGTMKYRFQVVASSFHKGRLKIVYDPSVALTNEYNTNYVRIVDLAEERDFTVEVGWGQQTPFLEHRTMLGRPGEVYSTSRLNSDPRIFANGILSVYVVNDLTVPNSIADNDIEINVFVKTGDDFEVVNPDERYIQYLSWYVPQGGEMQNQAGELGNVPDADNTTEENAPVQEQADEMLAPNNALTSIDHTYSVFFGDPVVSIRQILKRYNYSRTHVPPVVGVGMVYWLNTFNNLPLPRGYAPGAEDRTVTNVPYNYTKMTMMNYFIPAYTCWRGGIRWKYHVLVDNQTQLQMLSVSRDTSPTVSHSSSVIVPADNNANINIATSQINNVLQSMHDGGTVTAAAMNPVVEVELPYQAPQRFSYGKQGSVNLNLGYDSLFHNVNSFLRKENFTNVHMNSYVAAAEDFTLGFYTGPPVAYFQVAPDPLTI